MILNLVLKHYYYDMIKSGVKDEEYRRKCKYWKNRIWENRDKITAVRFYKGYTSESMIFKVNSIREGLGKESLGAPSGEEVYIIAFSKHMTDND